MRGGGLLVLLAAGLLLAACAAPRPSGPADPLPTFDAAVKVPGIYGVRVEPVDGRRLSLPMSRLLARAVAESLDGADVPATTERAAQNRYVLTGRAEANKTDPNVRFIVLIHWLLSDTAGREIGAYSQGVEGAWWQWENGDPRLLRQIGLQVTKPIARMLKVEEARLAPPKPAAIGLLLAPVTGAPGDGNAALTVAIRDVLQARDVTVTGDMRDAVARLSGAVTRTPLGGGQETIRIVWTVSTLTGEEMGRAVQENVVPAGSLDGAWGRVAGIVAAAAATGIGRVFDITGAADELNPGGTPPPLPDLPRAPGRAPPPGG